MTTITLEIADNLAEALRECSIQSKTSVQEIGSAVLEQWLQDQSTASDAHWTAEDIDAINDGLAQARNGQTIPHNDVVRALLAKVS
jgi:predicted transcriptional regulator